MERKDVCKYSLKRIEKVKTLPTKTSVKLSSKCEATFISDLLFHRLMFWQLVVTLDLTILKDMNSSLSPSAVWINSLNEKSRKATSN